MYPDSILIRSRFFDPTIRRSVEICSVEMCDCRPPSSSFYAVPSNLPRISIEALNVDCYGPLHLGYPSAAEEQLHTIAAVLLAENRQLSSTACSDHCSYIKLPIGSVCQPEPSTKAQPTRSGVSSSFSDDSECADHRTSICAQVYKPAGTENRGSQDSALSRSRLFREFAIGVRSCEALCHHVQGQLLCAVVQSVIA